MKLLVISDIHSNIWALEQILAAEKDTDILCCAGDLTDYGIAPCEVIDRVRGFKQSVVVQGNHDLHVVCTFRAQKFWQTEPDEYKWVHHNCRQLDTERIGYLEQLPLNAVFEADGYTYLVSHQYDEGYGTIVSPDQFDRFWKCRVPEPYADAANRRIILGHTHRQCIHMLADNLLWLNPGSASYRRPDDPDKTAHYAVIEHGMISLRRISYDRTPLLREAETLNHRRAMMEMELQDFYFFFGDAKTSRDALPGRELDRGGTS